MKTWALIPMKAYGRAKSRLSPVLSPRDRADVARSMFHHVLGAASGMDGILVATDGDDVARDAALAGASLIRDTPPGGLAQVVDRALDSLRSSGVDRALVLMADLPGIGPDDILAMTRNPGRAVAPDHSETGTNALLVPLSSPFGSSFGRPDSFACHRAGAVIVRCPGLAFDVDGEADWLRWRQGSYRRALSLS